MDLGDEHAVPGLLSSAADDDGLDTDSEHEDAHR
jgi:hypothetical protein